MKKIAFFDFDGTITTRDTFIEFIIFVKGKSSFIRAITKCLPWLIGWKLKLCSNSTAKERLFSELFKGMELYEFNSYCEDFKIKINSFLRNDIIEKINDFVCGGIPVIIVSASIENWIKPWALSNNIINVIGTQIECDSSNKLTGRFKTLNCNGEEKVNRIKNTYDNIEDYEIWAFGDSHGDDEMLSLATHKTLIKKQNLK